MAKPTATQELVSAAADALIDAGEEPSIISVQARLGSGSYTTVKRYLDVWKQQRARASAPEAPPAIAEQGAAFIRELWGAAQALAEEQVAQARELARRQVEEAQKAHADAEAALEQLEAHVEEQTMALTEREQTIAQLRDELSQVRAELGAALARGDELQRQAQELRADLERQQAGGRAEVGRLAAEMTALREQVAQILAGQRREE